MICPLDIKQQHSMNVLLLQNLGGYVIFEIENKPLMHNVNEEVLTRPEVIKLCSSSAHLSMINTTSERLKTRKVLQHFSFYGQLKFMLS